MYSDSDYFIHGPYYIHVSDGEDIEYYRFEKGDDDWVVLPQGHSNNNVKELRAILRGTPSTEPVHLVFFLGMEGMSQYNNGKCISCPGLPSHYILTLMYI